MSGSMKLTLLLLATALALPAAVPRLTARRARCPFARRRSRRQRGQPRQEQCRQAVPDRRRERRRARNQRTDRGVDHLYGSGEYGDETLSDDVPDDGRRRGVHGAAGLGGGDGRSRGESARGGKRGRARSDRGGARGAESVASGGAAPRASTRGRGRARGQAAQGPGRVRAHDLVRPSGQPLQGRRETFVAAVAHDTATLRRNPR